MPFFQNPFTSDFYGVWVLADRHASLDFVCPRNSGRGDEMVVAWEAGPYDLSGNDASGNSNDVLVVTFALNDFDNWTDIPVTITAATLAATTATEVVGSLNNNSTFADWFTATLEVSKKSEQIIIRQKQPSSKMRFYIKNGRTESVLRFNKLAGVAELPSYFDRHSIANRFNFPDSQNALIKLSTSDVDAQVIDNAVDKKGVSLGFSSSVVKEDYELLKGRSGLFIFKKNTVDESSRITQTIEYQAGAKVGDFAKKTTYVFTSTNTQPDSVTEVPYVLVADDLLTP